LDWKRGRFSVKYETEEISKGLRGWEDGFGDLIEYWRFSRQLSQEGSIYDEGEGSGREYTGPYRLPVIHVNHVEGVQQHTDMGMYVNDAAHVTLTFKSFANVGFSKADLQTGKYLKDRFVYDTKVFRVTNVQILGQIREEDIIVSIEATQVRDDELVDDAQWAQYATLPYTY
jgi:hypothetical protein